MTTLVLLHGAWHGAWCWAPLREELDSRGIASIAVELPAEEPDAGIHRYADAVVRAVDGHDRPIVVAHSLAGLFAPVVAERLDARGLVMLAALWPEPGRSAREQARELPGIYTDAYREAPQVRYADGSTGMPLEAACTLLYQDCEPQAASAAAVRLRPQHWRLWAEPCPLAGWPSVPTIGYACREDRLLGAEGMIRGTARASAPLAWLDSGHSPMLSVPGALAEALVTDVPREWAFVR
jgi:hypothetical protein